MAPPRGDVTDVRLSSTAPPDKQDPVIEPAGEQVSSRSTAKRERKGLTVEFELDGQPFIALNGGPDFTFSEAISFQVSCETQEEVDSYCDNLAEGGEEGPCGWLEDRFGLSWQIIPTALPRLLSDPDTEKAQRVMAAMLEMKKIDIDELVHAAEKVPA